MKPASRDSTKTIQVPPAHEQSGVIEVSADQQYGKKRYYPESHTARLFLKLLKQKSFSEDDVELIKLLGYRFLLKPKSFSPTEL